MNCYLVGTGNRDLNSPLNWSSTSGGTPADVLGSELITNGDFSTSSNWTLRTGWTISNGVLNINAVSWGGVSQALPLQVSNRWFKLTLTIVSRVSGDSLSLYIGDGNTVSITPNIGTYTIYLKGFTSNNLFSIGSSSFVGSIDNISIKEVLSVPNSSNPIIIDANSSIANGDVLSQSAEFNCAGFDFSGAAYTFTLSNAAYAFNVYGDIEDSVKRINGFSSTGYLYLKANCNIYSNGATQGWNRIYFDGVGATFTNQDDWNVVSSVNFRLANGEWNTNNKTITNSGAFNTEAGTKTLTLGFSTFNIGTWTNVYNTGFTMNYNTSTVVITQPVTHNFNCNFYNLTLQAYSNVTLSYRLQSGIIVHGLFTVNGTNASNYRTLITSDTIGTPRTITVNGSIVASNVDFRDINLAGTASRDLSAISGGSGDCGGNSGITFTPSQTQYYKHLGGGTCYFKDATKWYSESTLTTSGRVPLPQDDWFALENSFNATTTFTVDCPRIGRSMDLSAVSQNVTWRLANNIECYGSYVLGNNITVSGNFNTDLYGNGNCSFNTYIKYHYLINIYRGIYINNSDIITRSVQVRNNSFFDFNDYNSAFTYCQFLETSTIYLGNGLMSFDRNSGGVMFRCSNTVNLYSENSILKFNPTIVAVYDLFVYGGSKSFNKIIFTGSHTGNFIILDNNTFNELVIEKGRKLQITGGSTQTISPTGKFIADGSPTEGITIGSTNTTPFNLVYAGTSYHQVNYCNISYCNATANRFYAGMNSVSGGNNTGWLFKNYLKKNTIIL